MDMMTRKNNLFSEGVRTDPLIKASDFAVEALAPSNIAIVKYWGKYGEQLPKNPSISLTLRNAVTKTKIKIDRNRNPGFHLLFEGKENPAFHPKIQSFFERISPYIPGVKRLFIEIESSNTFPHSSGIASSASSMSALSLAILSLFSEFEPSDLRFKKQHSFLSRLGSGSAARSAFGGWVNWGAHPEYATFDNEYATAITDVHPVFEDFRDAILIVDADRKSVSSSAGHGLMDRNPFSPVRYEQAFNNMAKLAAILKSGDLEAFIDVCEKEALQLHALMMMSDPYFILLRPKTLEIIERIRVFRKESNIPIVFTCDAGPNVHVLYPAAESEKAESFIETSLKTLCQNGQILYDRQGPGPEVQWVEK